MVAAAHQEILTPPLGAALRASPLRPGRLVRPGRFVSPAGAHSPGPSHLPPRRSFRPEGGAEFPFRPAPPSLLRRARPFDHRRTRPRPYSIPNSPRRPQGWRRREGPSSGPRFGDHRAQTQRVPLGGNVALAVAVAPVPLFSAPRWRSRCPAEAASPPWALATRCSRASPVRPKGPRASRAVRRRVCRADGPARCDHCAEPLRWCGGALGPALGGTDYRARLASRAAGSPRHSLPAGPAPVRGPAAARQPDWRCRRSRAPFRARRWTRLGDADGRLRPHRPARAPRPARGTGAGRGSRRGRLGAARGDFRMKKTAAAVGGRSGAAPRRAARAALAPVRSRSRCRGRRGGRRGRGRTHPLARHRADGSPPARPRRSRSAAPPQSRPARRARNRAHHLRENEEVFAALRPGTVGYLFNASPSAKLGAAIRRAARGESLRPESRLDRVNPTLIFLRVARGLLALVVAPLALGARKGGDGPRRWARSPAAPCSGCSRVPSCSRSPAASSSSSRALPPRRKRSRRKSPWPLARGARPGGDRSLRLFPDRLRSARAANRCSGRPSRHRFRHPELAPGRPGRPALLPPPAEPKWGAFFT